MKRLTVLAAAFAAGLTTSAAYAQEAPVNGAAIFAASSTLGKPAEAAAAETAPIAAVAPVEVQDRGQFGSFTTAGQGPSNEGEKIDEMTTASVAEPAKAEAKDEPGKAEAKDEVKKAAPKTEEVETEKAAEKKAQPAEIAEAPVPQQRPELAAKARKVAALSRPGDKPTASDKKLIAETKKSAEKKVAALGAGGKYQEIVSRYASAYGVPVTLAHAVISIESNYRANATGRAGEVGLMQIKPATARMMGFSGSVKDLYSPENNIKYGLKYLGKARELGDGTTCGTILKYNAGHGAKRMNPVSAAYCSKVKRHLGSV